MIKNAFILAAGIGSRMKEAIDYPKCMINVKQKTLIEYILLDLYKAGVENIIVNTFYCAPLLESHISSLDITKKLNIIFAREETRLETAASIAKSMHLFSGDYFYTINTDSYWENSNSPPATQLAESFENRSHENIDQFLLLKDIDQAIGINGKGDFNLDDDGQIYFSESPKYVYTGFSIVNKRFFKDIPKDFYSIGTIWQDRTTKSTLEVKNVYGMIFQGTWIHIGDPKALAYTQNTLA